MKTAKELIYRKEGIEMEQETRNVYQKLAESRVKLQAKNLKKTGWNDYSRYWYFELKDFLPSINEIFNEVGLCSQFYIAPTKIDKDNGDIVEEPKAVLNIINVETPTEYVHFESPIAEAGTKGASAIQQLGSQHTYMRRYLWLEAMEIVESDGTECLSEEQKEVTEQQNQNTGNERKCSEKQLMILREKYIDDDLKKLLEVNKLEKLEDMTMKKASELITKIKAKEKQKEGN